MRSFSLSLAEACAVVRRFGGLPVFAHPGAYPDCPDPVAAVRSAVTDGALGLEAFHPYNKTRRPANGSGNLVTKFERMADELGLVKTGGTDFHGRSTDVEIGDIGLTEEGYRQIGY